MTFPPEVAANIRNVYDRLAKMGDYFATIVESDMKAGKQTPSPAVWAALKCWKEALIVAYRIGGLSPDEPAGERDPHDELAARRRSRHLPA